MIRTLFTVILTLFISAGAAAQPFKVDTVARAPFARFPVRLAFAPDGGKIFFTEKITGRVRVFHRSLLPDPFVSLSVESDGEQGLLGVEVHPRYPDSPYVYVLYTRSVDRSMVVERYRDSAGIGVDPRLLLVVPRLDDEVTRLGGCLRFGADGKLYVSVGDFGTREDDAQDVAGRRSYYGKILRLGEDGSIPADNPFPGRATWSYGHRNPLGFTFDRLTGEMYCTENGKRFPNSLNRVPRGANLGWPEIHEEQGNRMYEFGGDDEPGLSAVVMYRGDAFPRLRGKLLFGGYLSPTLWVASPSPPGERLTPQLFFRTNAGFADIQAGPDGAIYLVNGPYISSRILRLIPVAPAFVSEPITSATEDSLYVYSPEFRGTPPELALIAGPEGMTVDSVLWALRWMPTNAQARAGFHSVTVRARNGAGYADQTFTVSVRGTDDPPLAGVLVGPDDGSVIEATEAEPEVTFRWTRAFDADGDTVTYVMQLDTTGTFSSDAARVFYAGEADSMRVVLPLRSQTWYWRVLAADYTTVAVSAPGVRRLQVVAAEPTTARVASLHRRETEPMVAAPPALEGRLNLTYSVDREGYVRVSIFNLLGQEISVVYEGRQGAGTYSVDVGAVGLPNGIYFCKVQTPSLVDTRKVIVTE